MTARPFTKRVNYRPLPPYLTVDVSSIDGHGITTLEPLPEGLVIGVARWELPGLDPIRTPLGGFVNHSPAPNCRMEWRASVPDVTPVFLVTVQPVVAGDELTVRYTLDSYSDASWLDPVGV